MSSDVFAVFGARAVAHNPFSCLQFRVFEVATQFNAIFRAEQQGSNSPLLSLWTSRRVNSFFQLLRSSNYEDAAALRDALEASVFFATSMGRLGADFTARLAPLFEPRMHSMVVEHWKDGMQQLTETLKICRDAGVASPLTSQTTTTSEEAQPTRPEGPQPPPRQLLGYPPLARFVNSLLSGLNELRRCLLPAIFSQLRASLDEILKSIHSDLVANERAVLAPGFPGQAAALREAAASFKKVFADIVEPYVRGSLEAALGFEEGAVSFYAILRENEKPPVEETIATGETVETAVEKEDETLPNGGDDGSPGDIPPQIPTD